jgi:hypothetical protein
VSNVEIGGAADWIPAVIGAAFPGKTAIGTIGVPQLVPVLQSARPDIGGKAPNPMDIPSEEASFTSAVTAPVV